MILYTILMSQNKRYALDKRKLQKMYLKNSNIKKTLKLNKIKKCKKIVLEIFNLKMYLYIKVCKRRKNKFIKGKGQSKINGPFK